MPEDYKIIYKKILDSTDRWIIFVECNSTTIYSKIYDTHLQFNVVLLDVNKNCKLYEQRN